MLDTDCPRRRLPRVARKRLLIAACALAAVTPAGAMAGEISPGLEAELSGAESTDEIPVIVTFEDGLDPEAYEGRRAALIRAMRKASRNSQDETLKESGVETDEQFWLVNAAAVRATPAEIASLVEEPGVATIDSDRPITVREISGGAWGAAQSSPGTGNWGIAAIRADEVWAGTNLTGSGVRVGNIDTGVVAGNPAIDGKVIAWRDFVNGYPEPYDDHGHGTHTLGTVLGGTTTGTPIGVAPNATAIVAKAMDASGSGTASSLLAAAQWMTDPDGNPATADQPHVINNSWSAGDANDPWFRGMVQSWINLGIVPVFAAGNFGPGAQTIGSPAGYPESIAVGALQQTGGAASFSSRGPVYWTNADGLGPAAGTVIQKPDVSAPGASIVSAYDSGYATQNGTSMASPHIAGVAALVKQLNPETTPASIQQVLRDTAVDLGAPGPDPTYGAGRVDAMAVIEHFAEGPTPRANVSFVTTPPENHKRRRATYGISLSNASQFVWRVDEGPWSAPSADSRFTVDLNAGQHVIEVSALNSEGVEADLTPARHTLTIDRVKPRAVISWSARSGSVRFHANVIDDLSGVSPESIRWNLGNGTRATGTEVIHRFRSPRARRVSVRLTDRAGNTRVIRRWVRPRAATVRKLRGKTLIRRRAKDLKVGFASVRPGRVKVTLRPVRSVRGAFATNRANDGSRVAEIPAVLKVTARPVRTRVVRTTRGRRLTTLDIGRVKPGVYKVTAQLAGRQGRGERPATRTVRITR